MDAGQSAATTPERPGLRERIELASAGVPFRVKVAAIWVLIFALLGVLLWVASYDWAWMGDRFSFIAGGLKYTLYLALGGIALAFTLACFGALARISSNPVAYGIAGFYTSFFRGTPLIVQLFLIYLALPQFALGLSARFPDTLGQGFVDFFILDYIVVGIIALGLNYGAYMTEIFRAGIQSVSGGQTEAAEALGMTYGQKMRKVILPQALRVIIPPTGNEFIAMMKDTALISVLGSQVDSAELFRRAQMIGPNEGKVMEAFLIAAGLYWLLTIIFTFFQGKLEARLAKGYSRTTADPKKVKAIDDPTLTGGQH